jgi:hypothetical protein
MRYLTKKWDDGANFATLLVLKPLVKLKLLKVYSNNYFSNSNISG